MVNNQAGQGREPSRLTGEIGRLDGSESGVLVGLTTHCVVSTSASAAMWFSERRTGILGKKVRRYGGKGGKVSWGQVVWAAAETNQIGLA